MYLAISIVTMSKTSVGVEHSILKLHHNLINNNFKGLAALYFYGDIESSLPE